jgi:hypothetical protein
LKVGPRNAGKGVEQNHAKRGHKDGEVFTATPSSAAQELDSDISGFDPVVNDNGEKEGEGDPDQGRAETPSDVQAKDHPVEEVKSNAYD